jgi:Spy/CpxP family protein refolding chaperone
MSQLSLLPSRPARLWIGALALAVAGAFTLTAQAASPVGDTLGGGPGGHGMGMGGPGGGLMMGGPRHIEHMLDAVNASAEQRTQIRSILQSAMADLRSQRAAGTSLRQQAATLFAQPTVDARAAETLRQQMLAQHDQASQRMLQAMLDVSRVLTPEQRARIGEHMGKRRALMQRHRAEREALDRPGR